MPRRGHNFVSFLRSAALIAAFVFVSLAAYTGVQTQAFVAKAQRTTGHVVLNTNHAATVQFPTRGGIVVQHRIEAANASPGDTLALLYVSQANAIDVRPDNPSILWAPMWRWIELSIGALLVAIYGKTLVEDPLSVIGFKGARFRARR